MIFSIKSQLMVLGFAAGVLASPLAACGMTCTELVIPVTINSTNLVLPFAFTNGIPNTIQIQGTHNIGARYCEPASQSRATTLQVLVHGISYTRNCAGPPGQGYQGDKYSWIAYAGANAYPTLSIDRLGNGLSSHPDPYSEVQVNSEVDTIHALISKAKDGTLTPNGRKFKKIIYVGHSFGSILGNRLTAAYPSDVNAVILTGWTPFATQLLFDKLPSALAGAAAVEPARFGSLSPAYFILNSSSIVSQLFYYPNNYDPALYNLDYSTRGTVSYGEIYSGGVAGIPAPSFTGPVLLIAGENDNCFCPLTASGKISCGSGWSPSLANTTINLYPGASSLHAYALPKVGHCWNYHHRARLGFDVAHAWLKTRGF